MKLSILLSFILIYNTTFAQGKSKSIVIYSTNVKDSFDIIIITPKNYDTKKKYNTVYFLDAHIKSGTKMIELAKNKENAKLKDATIFIGIGHKGDYHKLRPRDFIPPKLVNEVEKKSTDKHWGHADLFHLFLEKELIPWVGNNYSVNDKRAIIGHSFGGLFAYYCLFHKTRLFSNHFALSPSLWVDNSNFFEREKLYYQKNKSVNGYLYMACGTLEFANYVLPTNRRMNTLLKERSYKGLKVEYLEKNWANHNSHVPLTLKEVMNKLEKL